MSEAVARNDEKAGFDVYDAIGEQTQRGGSPLEDWLRRAEVELAARADNAAALRRSAKAEDWPGAVRMSDAEHHVRRATDAPGAERKGDAAIASASHRSAAGPNKEKTRLEAAMQVLEQLLEQRFAVSSSSSRRHARRRQHADFDL